MGKKIKNKTEELKKSPVSFRKQLTGIITFSCIIAVGIQSLILIFMLISQVVVQEQENIYYLLENNNTKINTYFQYLEEMVLSIQDDIGIQNYFATSVYSEGVVEEQLKNIADLYSDRNRMEAMEPFIERICLFNRKGDTVCNSYYPVTIQEKEEQQKKYQQLYLRYQEKGKNFYFEIEGSYLNLCMDLYDEYMVRKGSCIFVLNKAGIEKIYSNLEKLKYYRWYFQQGKETLFGKEEMMQGDTKDVIHHNQGSSFGLKIHAEVLKMVSYRSVGTVMGSVVGILALMSVLLYYLGHKMAAYYVRPLETIASKIKLVGEGNFDTKLGDYEIEELQNISATFNEMTEDITRLVREVYETQLLAQQAQIQYLQAQMNPHFLYNVLSMIKLKAAMNGDKEVQEMLHNLSGLYQGKIFRKNEHFIYLQEEMEIVEFYLSLQRKRFGEKINYAIHYEGERTCYEKLMVPRLCIEPIVENAVCHGLEPKKENGKITIHLRKEDCFLRILVEDDGVGFDTEKMMVTSSDSEHSHVGLWNTRRMIHTLCGNEYEIRIESKIGEGTRVSVLLPIRNGDNYVESDDCR